MVEEEDLDLVYSEDLRRGEQTTEHVLCIKRKIGFLDIDCRRYFLDPERVNRDQPAVPKGLNG